MGTLGIDFGLKKIGVAIAEGELAEPLLVIENRQSIARKFLEICQEYNIEKIVIGLPEGEIVADIRRFGENLAKKTHRPVVYQDETLTTKETIAKMIEAGRGRKYRREKEDAFAAALILQKYLDRQRGGL